MVLYKSESANDYNSFGHKVIVIKTYETVSASCKYISTKV
jgi:hypothetical protein